MTTLAPRGRESVAMPRASALPPELPESGFTVSRAKELGIARSRLRAKDLTAPFHGVRVVGNGMDVWSRASAYSARMQPTQFFSHSTAALLHGLRMPENFREFSLHVTSLSPLRAPRGSGVTGHRSGGGTIVILRGLRVLDAVETWCQLSTEFGLDDLVAMGDGLVSRKHPATTIESLREAVDAYKGRGSRTLRTAMELVRPGTDSARETALRLVVVRAGLPEPEPNGRILNEYGAVIAHGDLVFRKYRTILEYEGRQHAESDRQFSIDISRLDELMEDDWRVIRVDKYLLARRATLIAKVTGALRKGGWTPGAPSR